MIYPACACCNEFGAADQLPPGRNAVGGRLGFEAPASISQSMSSLMNDPMMASPGQHAASCIQKSHAKGFEGRGRSAASMRRAHLARPDRLDFQRNWSLLMISSFVSREECAVHFGVTFQTACSWFDGHCRPYGDSVAHAVATLPRYAEVMGAHSENRVAWGGMRGAGGSPCP